MHRGRSPRAWSVAPSVLDRGCDSPVRPGAGARIRAAPGRPRASGGQRTKAESALGLRYRGGVPGRNAPVVVPPGGPLPVVRGSYLVRAADALDFGGVLDGCAERCDKIGENVVAGPMAPGTPESLDPRVFQP